MAFSKIFVVVLICLCELSTITLCRPSKNNHTSKPHRNCFPGDKIETFREVCTCSEDGRFQCLATTPKPHHQEELDIVDANISGFEEFMKQPPDTFWKEEEEREKLEEEIGQLDMNSNKEIMASKIEVPEFDIKLEEHFHLVL